MKIILLLLAEKFLQYMDKKVKASDEKLLADNDDEML